MTPDFKNESSSFLPPEAKAAALAVPSPIRQMPSPATLLTRH